MIMPAFLTDQRLRDACRNSCAEFGDPPCWEVAPMSKPCGECLRDVGYEPGDEFDEEAAVGRLL